MTKQQRHDCMASIKGKDTKPEMLVRRFLHGAGYRYRLHDRKLPGCPDLVFPSLRTVIFVNGCFWHGHEGCKYYRLPKSNIDFWKQKIDRNRERDAEAIQKLEAEYWNVIVIWECELRNKTQREEILERICRELFDIRNRTYARPCLPYADDDEVSEAAEPEAKYGE